MLTGAQRGGAQHLLNSLRLRVAVRLPEREGGAGGGLKMRAWSSSFHTSRKASPTFLLGEPPCKATWQQAFRVQGPGFRRPFSSRRTCVRDEALSCELSAAAHASAPSHATCLCGLHA